MKKTLFWGGCSFLLFFLFFCQDGQENQSHQDSSFLEDFPNPTEETVLTEDNSHVEDVSYDESDAQEPQNQCLAIRKVLVQGNGLEEKNTLPIAKEDKTNFDPYYVTALAFGFDGEDIVEVDTNFEWRFENPEEKNFSYQTTYLDNKSVVFQAKADIFDTETQNSEPSAKISVCAKNKCLGCSSCQEIVCSDPITLFGVINLEDHWIIRGDTFGIPEFEVNIEQNGRMAVTGLEEYKPKIEGKTVSFRAGDYFYTGEITTDRNKIFGEVYNLKTNEKIGQWEAERKKK